jgi:septal ring factor EnvC (AmiA/AmiB activator)
MSDEERLVAEINGDLKARAKADPRPIKEIVEASLQREFATAATAAVERRIDEKRQRIQTLEREINDRERELAEERDALERLQRQLEAFDDEQDAQLQEAKEKLAQAPRDPENEAIKKKAKKLGMTPHELLEELDST